MKRMTYLKMVIIAIGLTFSSVRCANSAKLLSAASPLLQAMGGNSNLSTLAGILQTPGLGKLLGPVLKNSFTLLAPSNDAFSALGAGGLSNLTKPENLSTLAGILKNHIVPGKLNAQSILGAGLKSAGGNALNLGGINMGSLIGGEKFNILPIDKLLQ